MVLDRITVRGARQHNLKNINVEIPRDRFTVITGLSGSGKSSLAFDTIFNEGQRRYMESFSAYARQFIGDMERPDVDKITGLSPVISIEQKTTNKNPRSTVGTVTEVYDFFRLLFARIGEAYSYNTGKKMVKFSEEEIVENIFQKFKGKKIILLAPLVRGRKGHYRELFEEVGILVCVSAVGDPMSLNNEDISNRIELGRQGIVHKKLNFGAFLESENLFCDLAKAVYFDHWVTPDIYSMRFDTCFYIAALPDNQTALTRSEEVTHSLWIKPQDALARMHRQDFPILPPTTTVLQNLARLATWERLRAEFGLA